ncbi:MAG: hypothetical protein ACI9PP_001156 [Halobacteriales archaeon]
MRSAFRIAGASVTSPPTSYRSNSSVSAFLVPHVNVDFGDALALLLPVVRLVLLARQRPLLTFEPLSLIGQVKAVD